MPQARATRRSHRASEGVEGMKFDFLIDSTASQLDISSRSCQRPKSIDPGGRQHQDLD